MTKLTPKQIKAYLNDQNLCPFCHLPGNMVGDEFDWNGKLTLFRVIKCYHCNNSFEEIFELRTIKPYEQT